MTEIITDSATEQFKEITGYDVQSFFDKYVDFTENHYPNIVNYYSNLSDISPVDSFNLLKVLMSEQKKIVDISILNANSLNNYEFWALIEYIEDMGSVLETANNASKWLRSSVTKNGYRKQIVSSKYTAQGQGLEQLEKDVLKSDNFRDSWVDTALQNELREEDYNLDGGELIKVIYKNNASLFLNGVVDNIDTAEKTYGKDIDVNLIIENDDLVILSYKDTVIQSVKILTELKKGGDSTFPERGIAMTGTSLAGFSYPIIFRQLANNFATDDTFKSFSIKDIKREQDGIFVEFTVETRAGEVFDDLIRL